MRNINQLTQKDIGTTFQVCAVCYKAVRGESLFWKDQPRLFFCCKDHALRWDLEQETLEDPVQSTTEETKPRYGWLRRLLSKGE